MATATQKDVWYTAEWSGTSHIHTSLGGSSVEWANEIQARWTNRTGTVYTMEYRCIMRKYSGTLISNTSEYNGYSISGDGATPVTVTNTTINFPTTGVNVMATISGTYDVRNGRNVHCQGGVQLGYYGNTWGSMNLSGAVALPAVPPDTPTISVTPLSSTSVSITYGTASFENVDTGTVYLYGGTSPAPTKQVASKTTIGDSTITLTGLTPGATYYYRARAVTNLPNAGGTLYSDYSTEIAVTLPIGEQVHNKFYGSVDSQAEKATKMLGPVNSQARRITKLYGSDNGAATRIL